MLRNQLIRSTRHGHCSNYRKRNVKSLLPGKAGDPGRSGKDNVCSSTQFCGSCAPAPAWPDLPERYGKWKSVHTRFARWAKSGVWERVFTVLTADRRNEYLMLDTTLVRAHQQAATGKGGAAIGL